MLREKDYEQLLAKNISEATIFKQLEIFKKGVPFVRLIDAATIGNGILQFSEEEMLDYCNLYEGEVGNLSVLKFVPASGAASRMFKFLFSFLDNYDHKKESLQQYIDKSGTLQLNRFLDDIEKFPFYDEIFLALKNEGFHITNPKEGHQAYTFVKKLLLGEEFNFGDMPKGLLPFHNYKTHKASAFEEHLNEAVLYASSSGNSRLHFTISESHKDKFERELNKIREKIERQSGTAFHVSFSFQKGKTDTVAVTPNNELFRNSIGELVFRPSGHGALIENLNEQNADLIFIMNIDNVAVKNLQAKTAFYKKVLAGKCLEVQKKAFDFARQLDTDVSALDIEEVFDFLKAELNVRITKDFSAIAHEERIDFLKSALNRPIRVCGMVKNEGEPGGGPFWVKNGDNEVSLQIVESAQINKQDEVQRAFLKSSTHFNPVDLVCAIKNYKGEKYNLLDFVDEEKGFITSKTFQGRQLKGLELPGLWNGAMAGWNTVFVEVPLITFNPVKTVTDLLKEAHQPGK